MTTTLAILLYLGQIFGGTSYTPAEMDSIIAANQQQINGVLQAQSLVTSIDAQYDSTAVIIYTNTYVRP